MPHTTYDAAAAAPLQLQLIRTTVMQRAEEAVRRLAPPMAGATIAAVADDLGVSHRVARDALTRLARQQRIVRTGRGRYAPADEAGLAPRPANGARRGWGTVITAAREALADEPAREWQASELVTRLHGRIIKTHAAVILATLAKAGNLERVGSGRYRVVDLSPHTPSRPRVTGEAWSSVAMLDGGMRLLRDRRGRLWVARPARVSDTP